MNEQRPQEPAAMWPESASCAHCRGALRHGHRERCPAAPPVASTQGVFASDIAYYQPRRHARGRVQASPFGFWRGIGAAASTVVLMSCVAAYFNLIFDDLTSAYQDPGELLLWIGAAVAIGIFSMGLMWWSARVYAKVMFTLLAVTLITVAFFMLVFAPVYRQINDPGIAEYRASNAMYFFGMLTMAAGIALAIACVRWALRPDALQRLNRWRRPLGAAYGVLLGLLGLMMLSLIAFVIAADDGDGFSDDEFGIVAGVIAITAFGAQFFIPGIILTYHGISSSMGERSSEFKPPIGLLVAIAFAGVVVVGQLNMRMESPLAAPMPPLHILGAVLPGLTYIALASRGSWLRGRSVRGMTWRQLTLAWGLAIAIGAMSAGFVNSIGGLGVTILLLVHNGAFEGVSSISSNGYFSTYSVWDVISDADYVLSNNDQWVANILAIAVIPPLGEEFLKGLSVRFLMRRNTTRAQAFALGAAAGAGFGFVEALLYGAGAISGDLGSWWLIMTIRAGSTSLHCFNTGLVGLAWWHWSIAGRKRPALALFFTAVLFHAIWNGFSVTLDSEIFWLGTLHDKTIEYVAYGFVTVMALALITAIPLIARSLREPPPPPVATTPLARLEPWMELT